MSKAAERQAAYKARMKDKGFCQTNVWTHFEDREKVVAYARQLAEERGLSQSRS